jgi:hypothetical protein
VVLGIESGFGSDPVDGADSKVMRPLPDGARDHGFGVDGVVTVNAGSTVPEGTDRADATSAVVAVDGDGILFVSYLVTGQVLTKLNADGSVDTSYGDRGEVQLGNNVRGLNQVLAWPDGSAAAVGMDPNSNIQVARVSADGVLLRRAPYTPDGKPLNVAEGLRRAWVNGCVAEHDGSVGCVGVMARDEAETTDAVALRIGADGAFDPHFGTGGHTIVQHPSGIFYDGPGIATLEAGGSMVDSFRPSGSWGPTLLGFTPSGRLDPAFGGGILTTPPFAAEGSIATAQDSQGRLLVAWTRFSMTSKSNWLDIRRFRADSADVSVTDDSSGANGSGAGRGSRGRGAWSVIRIHNRGPLAPGSLSLTLRLKAHQRLVAVRGATCHVAGRRAHCVVTGMPARGNRRVHLRFSGAALVKVEVHGRHHDDRPRNNRCTLHPR